MESVKYLLASLFCFVVAVTILLYIFVFAPTYNDRELTILETKGYEMNAKVISIFNYTITEDDFNRSMKDIEMFGGDCLDYSRYYEHLAKENNVTGKMIYMDIHVFYLIYDDTGYCVLDQDEVVCAIIRVEQ